MSDIKFFGDVDRNPVTKKIVNSLPAHYHIEQIELLNSEIDELSSRLKNPGAVPADNKPYVQGELEAKREKLDQIMGSIPKLNGQQKDSVAKMYGELGGEIATSLFTKDEMRGGGSPHEEYRRAHKPCIPIDGKIAEMCGLTATKGLVCRNDANRAWKMMGRAIGAPTNVETLRK